jgi:OOP family OmpA-OmpF porin
MKNFTIAFLVFITWSFFGLWFYHWLQRDAITMRNDTTKDNFTEQTASSRYEKETLPLVTRIEKAAILDTLSVTESLSGLRATTEQGDLLFVYPENIEIKKNSATIYIPTSTQGFKYKLNSYLLEHPNTELVITSKYSAEENIESSNYGKQRAKQIKAILVDAGVAAQRIVLKPHITPIQFKNDTSFDDAFSFTIQPLDLERIENSTKAIPESKTIYPRYSSSGILDSTVLKMTLQEAKMALEANSNLKITVIGHTDNIGNATDNYNRGLEFAKQVRWYLVSKGGINRKSIRAVSKGESEAIASNRTEKGRNLNQRIELKFSTE